MLPNRRVSEIATGRWPWLLSYFGVPETFLKNKHGPCPLCGGKDRFRFDDKQGRGSWICNQCGSGDGFKLLELFKGWSFREVAFQVEQIAGTITPQSVKHDDDAAKKMAVVKRIWNETEPVSKGDPVWTYLSHRTGVEIIPASVRYHPALAYVDGEIVEYFPALVAAVTDDSGFGVGVHRIYLTSDGTKANVGAAKKLLAGKPLSVAAVRLGPLSECLGIAEGIETALSASMRFGVTTWAAISAGMMEKWIPPSGVSRVVVFGDNDASFTGQAAAYRLAQKLTAKNIAVEVRIPEWTGKDWADK